MAITYVGSSSASTDGATSLFSSPPAGVEVGDLLLIVFGFEDVPAGSGPWIDPSGAGPGLGILGEAAGWLRVFWQAPSADGGCGLEVWAGVYGSGAGVTAEFTGTYAAVAARAAWRGEYEPTGEISDGAVRAGVTDQVAGDDPACPSVYAYADELVIAVAADQLLSPGYGDPTPAGWTTRIDVARAGAHGNVEACIADKIATVEGNTGTIPFAASAASGGIGGTGTIAVRPTAVLPPSTSPLIDTEYAVAN